MPRVYRKKAGKDYPGIGVVKGEMYYIWSFYRQRPSRSKTPPTRAMLTQNETKRTIYELYDNMPEVSHSFDLSSATIALDEARETEQEKFDNLPEGLQYSETGQRLESNVSAIDDAISEVESLISDMESEEDEVADEDGNPPDDFEYSFDPSERWQSTEPELE